MMTRFSRHHLDPEIYEMLLLIAEQLVVHDRPSDRLPRRVVRARVRRAARPAAVKPVVRLPDSSAVIHDRQLSTAHGYPVSSACSRPCFLASPMADQNGQGEAHVELLERNTPP